MRRTKQRGDLTYHGYLVRTDRYVTEPCRIEVELTSMEGFRKKPEMLKRLLIPEDGAFNWGYDGHGPYRAAEAVLSDALEQEELDKRLVRAFACDFLTQVTGEWRIRRGMVLRWVRGWCAENDEPVPIGVGKNVPADPWDEDDE